MHQKQYKANAQKNSNGASIVMIVPRAAFPGVAAASGYRPNEGGLVIDDADPDVLEIDLELSR